jgi:7-keto-8-aminopelargonate synthetase-like enzyme
MYVQLSGGWAVRYLSQALQQLHPGPHALVCGPGWNAAMGCVPTLLPFDPNECINFNKQ